jgi:hypothetical protein
MFVIVEILNRRLLKMHKLTSLTILLVSFAIVGCKKEKKDNTTNLAALAILSQPRGGLTPQAAKNTGTARNSAASAIQSASRAARAGSVSFFNDTKQGHPDAKLFAQIHKLRLDKAFKKDKNSANMIGPKSLATSTGGLTCTSTGCEGTMNGTVNCPSGGTLKLTNVTTKISFAADPNDPFFLGFDSTMQGQITLNKCASSTPNYLDYPNYLAVVGSGTLTVNSKSIFKVNSLATPEQTTMNMNFNVNEESTVSSNDFKADANTTLKIENLLAKLTLAVDSKATNLQFTASESEYTFKGDYEDTLNGSFTTSGQVNGEAVNTSLTYDKSKIYKYSVSCKITFATEATDCTITMK